MRDSSGTVADATVDTSLNLTQGFQFVTANQTPLGYLTSLTVGTTPLAADLSVTLPTGGARAVVAVLRGYGWKQASGDALAFEGQISSSNKQLFNQAQSSATATTAVSFDFLAWDFDMVAGQYFKTFAAVGGPLQALWASGRVEATVNDAVTTPPNYTMRLILSPTKVPQDLAVGTAVGKSTVRSWAAPITK